jgi:hypothetical protein
MSTVHGQAPNIRRNPAYRSNKHSSGTGHYHALSANRLAEEKHKEASDSTTNILDLRSAHTRQKFNRTHINSDLGSHDDEVRICISLLSKRTYDRALGRRIRLVEVLVELIVCADLIRKVNVLQAGFPAYPTHDSRHDALIISQQQKALTTTCYQSLFVR